MSLDNLMDSDFAAAQDETSQLIHRQFSESLGIMQEEPKPSDNTKEMQLEETTPTPHIGTAAQTSIVQPDLNQETQNGQTGDLLGLEAINSNISGNTDHTPVLDSLENSVRLDFINPGKLMQLYDPKAKACLLSKASYEKVECIICYSRSDEMMAAKCGHTACSGCWIA